MYSPVGLYGRDLHERRVPWRRIYIRKIMNFRDGATPISAQAEEIHKRGKLQACLIIATSRWGEKARKHPGHRSWRVAGFRGHVAGGSVGHEQRMSLRHSPFMSHNCRRVPSSRKWNRRWRYSYYSHKIHNIIHCTFLYLWQFYELPIFFFLSVTA